MIFLLKSQFFIVPTHHFFPGNGRTTGLGEHVPGLAGAGVDKHDDFVLFKHQPWCHQVCFKQKILGCKPSISWRFCVWDVIGI
jgi:hypothetical protein